MFFDTEIFDKGENVKDKAEKEEAQASLSQVPSVVNKSRTSHGEIGSKLGAIH